MSIFVLINETDYSPGDIAHASIDLTMVMAMANDPSFKGYNSQTIYECTPFPHHKWTRELKWAKRYTEQAKEPWQESIMDEVGNWRQVKIS